MVYLNKEKDMSEQDAPQVLQPHGVLIKKVSAGRGGSSL